MFGGGNVLRGFYRDERGRTQCRFRTRLFARGKMRITAEDLNDIHPRKVYFFPAHRQGAGQEVDADAQRGVGQARAGLRQPTEDDADWRRDRAVLT
ncbi:hypothetical protein ACFS07_22675 [Undibacterium arcticum]